MIVPGTRQAVAAIARTTATIALIACAGCATSITGAPTPQRSAAPASPAAPASDTAAPTARPAPDEPTLPPGATPGLDDLNGDGMPDPTCGTADYGGGLVVRIPCDYADYATPPTADTKLVTNSLFGLPGAGIDLNGVSASAVQGRTASGQHLVVLFITADTLFATGSAQLSGPAETNFDALAQLIRTRWPNGTIQVRGHTDATGAAAANQVLSEHRAQTVVDHLATRGIDRARLTAVGLGQTVPLVNETNPDGSPNATAQQYDRRVELAVQTP